jgi:hypothetical protein
MDSLKVLDPEGPIREADIEGTCREAEKGQSRHFGYVPVNSGLHPTPDMSLRRNN